jgi:hypothetical protein
MLRMANGMWYNLVRQGDRGDGEQQGISLVQMKDKA